MARKADKNLKWWINRSPWKKYLSCEGKALKRSMEMAGLACGCNKRCSILRMTEIQRLG
jgi:hypothetical protein